MNFKGKQISLFSAQNPFFVIWRKGRRGLLIALASKAGGRERRWFAPDSTACWSRAGPGIGSSQVWIRGSSFTGFLTLLGFFFTKAASSWFPSLSFPIYPFSQLDDFDFFPSIFSSFLFNYRNFRQSRNSRATRKSGCEEAWPEVSTKGSGVEDLAARKPQDRLTVQQLESYSSDESTKLEVIHHMLKFYAFRNEEP